MATLITKTVTLEVGESFTLPPNSSILGVIGTLGSTCDNLPNPETLNCYYWQWEIEAGSDDVTDAWENGNLVKVTILGKDYLLGNSLSIFIDSDPKAAALKAAIDSIGLFQDVAVYQDIVSSNGKFGICFKAIPSLIGDSTYMQISAGDRSNAFTGTKVNIPSLDASSYSHCSCS